MAEKRSVTWFDVNNIKLVVGVSVSVVLAYAALFNKVGILENKVDNLVEINRTTLEKYASVESRYGKLSLDVQSLKTVHNIK